MKCYIFTVCFVILCLMQRMPPNEAASLGSTDRGLDLSNLASLGTVLPLIAKALPPSGINGVTPQMLNTVAGLVGGGPSSNNKPTTSSSLLSSLFNSGSSSSPAPNPSPSSSQGGILSFLGGSTQSQGSYGPPYQGGPSSPTQSPYPYNGPLQHSFNGPPPSQAPYPHSGSSPSQAQYSYGGPPHSQFSYGGPQSPAPSSSSQTSTGPLGLLNSFFQRR